MISNKSRSNIDWRAQIKNLTIAHNIMDLMLPIPTIPSNSSTQVSCCSGKVISLLNLFMYLGEFFEAILEEHDINPMNYDRILSNVDAHI